MEPHKVYVRAPNWVGDVVMATAAFGRIRAGFQGAHITCGIRPALRSLLDGSAYFDDYLEAPRGSSLRDLLRHAAELRRRRFDLAVVLPNSLATGLGVALAGIPHRCGYRQGRPGLMNVGLRAASARPWWRRRGPRRVPRPMPEYYDALLDRLALPSGPGVALAVTAAEREECEAWFAERGVPPDQPVVALNAGASYGASKLWEADRFAAVARHFAAQGMAAVFLSGPSEAGMVRQIARDAGVLAAVDPVLPVRMLKPMIARAAMLITTDSGPRHVAVALDVPVVCLIGSTDPRYSSYRLQKTALLRVDLDCSPCQRKVCPLGHRRCMTEITVDQVIDAAEQLLARQR